MNASSVGLKVRVGFTLALIVLGLSALGSWWCVKDLSDGAARTRQGYRAVVALDRMRAAVHEAEAGRRGFAQTRDRSYLDVAAQAAGAARAQIAALRELPLVASSQGGRLDELDWLVRARLDSPAADPTAGPGRPGGVSGGPDPSASILGLIKDFADEEGKVLSSIEKEAEATSARAAMIIVTASVLSVMIAVTSWVLVSRDVAARAVAETALREAQLHLEQRVEERTAELAEANDELRRSRGWLEERVAERTADLRQEVGERERAARALRETTVLQRAILDSANYAIISATPDGTVRTFNAAAERWLGYTQEEVAGRQSITLFHDPHELARRQEELAGDLGLPIDPGFEVLVTRARLGAPDEHAWTYVRKDGRRLPVLLSVTALRDDEEDVAGFLVIGSDITERKRHEEELRRAKDAAEGANRAKSEFLANMSHELRTPLNSVIGFTGLLLKNKSGGLREQDLAFLGRVLDNGKHLLGLINQVLDLAKVEAGRLEVELAAVDVAALVGDTLAQMEGQVRDRDIELKADLPSFVAPLRADAGKLKQVLINLVGNALKFTERGSVTVRAEADEADGSLTALEVSDTGIGIPPEKLETIFEAFQQADVSTTRKYGGTGLGLTIARSLCQLMGYRISVRSRAGEGSTFRVELGAGPEPDAARPRDRETRELILSTLPALSASLSSCIEKGRHVLVIDDDSDSRLLLTQYVEDCGCRVVAVGSGPEGLHYAKEFRPDLIILDLMMPGMNGWEVLKRLKANPELSPVPVVVVSIVARENRGTLLGAVDLLDKPVSREALAAMLRRNLLPRRGTRPRALVIDDNEDARRLLTTYLNEEGFETREAVHGRDALDKLDGPPPDLILLDLMMPVMDGMTFLEALRRDPRHLLVPVIVVTAKDLTVSETERLRAQSSAVLRKGGELADGLKCVVREILRPAPAG